MNIDLYSHKISPYWISVDDTNMQNREDNDERKYLQKFILV